MTAALLIDLPVSSPFVRASQLERLFELDGRPDSGAHTPQTAAAPADCKARKTAMTRRSPSPFARNLVEVVAPKLSVGPILDYGCGRGTDVIHYRQEGLRADGYDPYPPATCARRLPAPPDQNTRLVSQPKRHGSYDIGAGTAGLGPCHTTRSVNPPPRPAFSRRSASSPAASKPRQSASAYSTSKMSASSSGSWDIRNSSTSSVSLCRSSTWNSTRSAVCTTATWPRPWVPTGPDRRAGRVRRAGAACWRRAERLVGATVDTYHGLRPRGGVFRVGSGLSPQDGPALVRNGSRERLGNVQETLVYEAFDLLLGQYRHLLLPSACGWPCFQVGCQSFKPFPDLRSHVRQPSGDGEEGRRAGRVRRSKGDDVEKKNAAW